MDKINLLKSKYSPIIIGSLIALAGIVSYLSIIRPWQLRWGSTTEEVEQELIEDDIVLNPTFNATRAVTINASPENIWPWIQQIGMKRAGWYSYDWIDNLGKPSATEILPELQNLKPGDLIPMSPDGKFGLFVKDFELNKWMLWWDKEGDTSWLWLLNPINERQTRLITRVRLKYRLLSPWLPFLLLLDVGDIVMMRKCMLGIQWRSEALQADSL